MRRIGFRKRRNDEKDRLTALMHGLLSARFCRVTRVHRFQIECGRRVTSTDLELCVGEHMHVLVY